jgi:hypothetical protein
MEPYALCFENIDVSFVVSLSTEIVLVCAGKYRLCVRQTCCALEHDQIDIMYYRH